MSARLAHFHKRDVNMFYGDTLEDTRAHFFTSWEKYKQNLPLTPLESQIVAVIQAHPEYHVIFDNPEMPHDESASNPFLHLGLHLAIRDQISTNLPAGMKAIYQSLLQKLGDPLAVEHVMMEQLALTLWEIQSTGKPFDPEAYLEALKKAGST